MRKNVRFYKCNVCKNVIGLIEGDPSKIGELPQVIFPYVGSSIIYAYNNKGNLLETEIEL